MIFDRSLLKDTASLIMEQSVFDRTGTFHSLDGYTVIQEIPTPEKYDFMELCVSRAKEIASINKTINLLWSGGADSTLVLLLLEQAGVPDDQIRILCSGDSFIINRALGDLVIDRYQVDSPYFYDNKLQHFISENEVIVSGIGMDMLTFGFDVELMPTSSLDDLVEFMQSRTSGTKEQYSSIFRKLEQASGYPCTTVKEYSRLKNLVLCWQPELLNIGILANKGIYGEHFINFYQTKEFQQWSLISNDSRSDQYGNKHIVAKSIETMNRDFIPKLKPKIPMLHRFLADRISKITDDWNYITDDS